MTSHGPRLPGKEYGLYSVGNGELLKIFEEVKNRL